MIICPKCSKLHNGRYQDKTGGKKHWCFDCHQKHNAVGTPAYAFAYEWFRSVGLPSGMRQNPLDVIDRMMIAYRIKTGGDWPIPRLRNRTIKIKSWETVPTLNTRSGNSNRRSVVYPRCSYNPAITAQATEDEVFAYLQSIHPYPRTVVPHTANGATGIGFDFSVYLDGTLVEVDEAKTESTVFTPREMQAIQECEKLKIPYYLNLGVRKQRILVRFRDTIPTGQRKLAIPLKTKEL